MSPARTESFQALRTSTHTLSPEVRMVSHALERGAFFSVYEPKRRISTKGVPNAAWRSSSSVADGVELLTRMHARDEQGSTVSLKPAFFIEPLMSDEAVDAGITSAFTVHCLREAHQLASQSQLPVWVNVDPVLFELPDFRKALHEEDLNGVGIEILETREIDPSSTRTRPALHELHGRGILFSIDDYVPSCVQTSEHMDMPRRNTVAVMECLDGVPPHEIKIAGAVALNHPNMDEYVPIMQETIAEVSEFGPDVITVEAVTHSGQIHALQEIMTGYPRLNCNVQSYTFNPYGDSRELRATEVVHHFGRSR